MKRLLLLLLSLVLALPGWVVAQTSADAPDHTESVYLRAGQLPAVSLSRDLLYRILVAEFAAQRGHYEQASRIYLDLARDTLDARLARRGFQAAMAASDTARAYEAARMWALLAPNDPEAAASSLALAATSGNTAGLAATLERRIREATDTNQAIVQASVIVGKMSDKRIALEVLDKVIAAPYRQIPVARLALADAAWDALDAYRALAEARAALALDPDSEPAAQRILEYGIELEPSAVLAQTRSWLNAHPNARKLSLMYIAHLVRRQEYGTALSHVQALRQHAPEDFDLLYTEAEVQFHAGHNDAAARLLQEYIQVQSQRREALDDRATNAMAESAEARLLLVRIAEREGRLEQAIAELDRIDDPSLRFQAQIHKAVLQARLGKLAEARKTLDLIAARDDRERTVVALTLASAYRNAGRTDEAVEVLVRADREIPDSSEIKYDLAMLYERQGRQSEFEAAMRRVIELAPDHANAHNALGYTFVDQNRQLDEARALLERALDLEPDNPFILDSVGWYFYRIDDHEAAIDYLRRAYQRLPEAEVGAHLGEVLWQSGRKDEALEIWRKAHEQQADNETLVETLGRFGVRLP